MPRRKKKRKDRTLYRLRFDDGVYYDGRDPENLVGRAEAYQTDQSLAQWHQRRLREKHQIEVTLEPVPEEERDCHLKPQGQPLASHDSSMEELSKQILGSTGPLQEQAKRTLEPKGP